MAGSFIHIEAQRKFKISRDMRVESSPQQQQPAPKQTRRLPLVILTRYYQLSVCNEESRCGAAHAPLMNSDEAQSLCGELVGRIG